MRSICKYTVGIYEARRLASQATYVEGNINTCKMHTENVTTAKIDTLIE